MRHFSKRFSEMRIENGYAIQRAWVALEVADGRTIKGRKIGLTSRAMQQASQITEPDFAPLMDAFTRPTAAKDGDNFHVDYGPLGSVAFRFI